MDRGRGWDVGDGGLLLQGVVIDTHKVVRGVRVASIH